MERIKNFFKDESGASAVEYAMLVAVLAVVLLGGVNTFYGTLSNIFTSNATTIGTGS
jgi:pilus assembly protein Flp/PilA